MLRHALSKSSRPLQGALIGRRFNAAAKGHHPKGLKRALNKQQLDGTKPKPGSGGEKKAPSPPPNKPPPTAAAATPSSPAGGGGGDSTPLVIGVALLGAGGAALYYYQSQSEEGETTPAPASKEEDAPKEEETAKEEEALAVAREAFAAEEEAPEETVEKPATSIQGPDGSNRVLQIEIPMEEGTRSAPPPPEVEAESPHPEGGNRVTMESFQKGAPAKPATPVSSIKDSIKELQASIDQETSQVIKRANQEVMRSFDESLFEGLDEMSPAQLKARVMQLATEMKERTRWEALRLKEFLAMKEKETADKYLDVLQKQRLEFEGILQRRLLEQEHEMTTLTNAKLQEKDGDVKEMIDTAISKLGEEHQNEKKAITERADQEIKAKYEQMFSQKLEEIKTQAMDEMERKVQALEALNKKLKDLENALESSQSYHEGSLQAHRLSAAALALAEKMESNKGAGAELNALKSVAGRDNVIAAALSSVPESVGKGVPTLPELQARFDAVAKKTRQAALVPSGLSGLEGQLAGMMFASLKFPPKPDDPPPEDGSSAEEYILVRAKKHVQVGELDKAVQQLDKLDGQAAFTVQGWKKDATDRVAVEQALKVIKMECALLNESMSKAP